MRVTIDIDEKQLERLQAITGIRKRSPAVRHALRSYLREMEKRLFLEKILAGRSDYPLTNEELETLATNDAD